MSINSKNVGRPLQAEAYELALGELKKACPNAVKRPQVVDAVMNAVLDLAAGGQRDIAELARYAARTSRRERTQPSRYGKVERALPRQPSVPR